jgi:crotonobetainyl-CoA:carnitine CoA-transferase CaiB-like acyl-CoA transferase
MPADLPLAGLRVLDLSRLLPGGFCSLMLADLGDVLKVEDTGMGDYVRWAPPYVEGAEESAKSALFLSLNRNKRSIRVDLKSEQGREVLLRLVRDHDVLLESFRPGVLDRLGVGYERLREENPGLVYCAITGYGQDGPYRDRAGHDMNYLALGGLLGLTGDPDGAPVQAVGSWASSASSPRCASATALARASSSTSRCSTARCRGSRWSLRRCSLSGARRSADCSRSRASTSATAPTRAPTAGSRSARSSRSSGRRGVAASGART